MKARGFTLIEILVVVAILAIITAVAIPSYRDYVLKSRRYDGLKTLNLLVLAQERYYNENNAYSSSFDSISAYIGDAVSDYYTFTVTINSNGYTLTATANADQSADDEKGQECNPLTLTINGLNRTELPEPCWAD